MAVRHQRARRGSLLAVPTTGAVVAGLLSAAVAGGGGANAAAAADVEREVPLYAVVSQGMSAEAADRLAERAGIPAALAKTGVFSYSDAARYGKVPTRKGEVGKDEDGNRTVERGLKRGKLGRIDTLPEEKAVDLARDLLTLPRGFETRPRVSHTRLELADLEGQPVAGYDLDTTVSFDLSLDGHRVVGTGNRNRVAFNGAGRVIALTQALRHVEPKGHIGIIGPETALAQCQRMYGDKVGQLTPELVYHSPPLARRSRVAYLVPHYACRPAAEVRDDHNALGKLVPAAPELTPEVTLFAEGDGSTVKAQVELHGGQAPYKIRWSSSTSKVRGGAEEVAYQLRSRDKGLSEGLTATVTDANGIVSAASVVLAGGDGQAEATGFGGEGGLLASVGIEQTIDEWQCAQDSANGFRSVMQGKGHSVAFDWRGTNAWEKDFKRTSAGGIDSSYVDAVDAQWYTGHGWSGGFTFKNASQDDGTITPADSRWGDNFNLEWMQLESCQVLRDTNGFHDYFQRWAPAFDGLHVLNGFHTNAYCVGGGTGRAFAEYLFPTWWRPALTIPQAWQAMANDKEPNGVVWRSVSPAKAGWVTNLGDHFWGQGSVGPDIPLSQQIGWVSLTGTV